jgi:predicted acyl esterase
MCQNCGRVENESKITNTYAPILTFSGYSAKIDGSKICVGYTVNYESLRIYESKMDKEVGTVKFGITASPVSSIYAKYETVKNDLTPMNNAIVTTIMENIPSFDEKLHHPDRNDAFWNTRNGGGERRNAIQNADIPILLTAGFYDISTGGIFDMWNALNETTKAKSAFIVHPYNHGVTPSSQPIQFDNATIEEKFGDYQVKWLNAIRMGEEPFVERGKITYYKLFGDTWCTDEFVQPKKQVTFTLGEGEKTYFYNPYAPAVFNGGLTAITGNAWQEPPNSRYDIISVFTPEFEEDTFIKGKMQAKLRVKSDCEDTCFYVRVSLVKEEGAYGLRDDINQISNFEELLS